MQCLSTMISRCFKYLGFQTIPKLKIITLNNDISQVISIYLPRDKRKGVSDRTFFFDYKYLFN